MFLDRLHPEDRPGIVERMNAVIAVKGDSISEEFRFKTAGGYKFFYDRSYIKYDAEGNPLRILGAMQDITEREKAKKAILESEEKFSRSFHSNLLGLALYDEGFNIVDVNDVYIQILESTREELIGKHSDEAGIISKVDPLKKAGIDAEVEDLLQKAGKLNNYEMEIEKRNGQMATILISMEPLRLNERDHWLTSAIDISEKKKAEKALQESEEKYRALVENAPEALVVFGVEVKQFVSVSESATKLFGMSKEALLQNGPLEVSPEYQPGGRLSSELAAEKIQLAIEGEKPVFEWTHCDHSGNPVPCEIWLVRLPSENEILIRGSIIDITERKKTEAEILKSKMQFQNLVENIPGVYWVNNLDAYETLYISPSYETIWGLTCEGLYRNPADFINAVHPEDKPYLEEAHKNIAEIKKVNTTFRIIRPDGNIRWISANTNVITDERGNMIEYGYAEDITQRKLAEKVLEESERFLKETQFIAKLGTYSLDIKTGKWSSSEILNDIFGIDADFDKTVENWESIVHPEWKKIMSDYLKDEVIGRKKKFDKEYKIIRKSDQAEHWVHGIGRLKLNNSGEPILMVGTIQDISERKKAEKEIFQSEQRYRLMFYNNPLPMWMTTFPGLDIIDVNEAAIKQYGYSREEFLKLNTRQLRPAEDVENFLKEVDKMQPDTINLRNWRHKKKDGTIIHVETYSHQIIYEGERVWLGLSHDVTEKYEAKELLQKSYEDIRQLVSKLQSIREDERTGIAREIHDELGQQLTGLKMDLHWLSRKIKDPEKEISDKMQESIELINATITSVRKISTDLRPSILDDLGLLPALEWQGDEFEKRSGTTVEFINEAGDITVQPEAATAIFRIYQELLTNIARHANASLVKAVLFKDDSSLYFSITDNGVGFDIETKSNKKTLGLLGIKERTLLLGGTYEFKSKPGKGSVTTISIPLHLVKNAK
ncbi:MAG: PAS domain S-box protein [Chitinophagaceae bacterium]|nr:PAS domain S-box protein [Chitinophagaceae bacterium]